MSAAIFILLIMCRQKYGDGVAGLTAKYSDIFVRNDNDIYLMSMTMKCKLEIHIIYLLLHKIGGVLPRVQTSPRQHN